jgi:hypothetical protein
MNTDRILNIVMMEMATDKLKLEAELESYINSKDMTLNDKTNMIKSTLFRLASAEVGIAKFNELINNNNNENQKQK